MNRSFRTREIKMYRSFFKNSLLFGITYLLCNHKIFCQCDIHEPQ